MELPEISLNWLLASASSAYLGDVGLVEEFAGIVKIA